MNRGVTILNNNDIYSHQIFIRKGLPMKRENKADITIQNTANDDFLFWQVVLMRK